MDDDLYGSLKTTPNNIGEEVQIIAAKRFLPRVDIYCHREKLDKFKSDKKTKLIMNGWYMHKPKHFPPSSDIKPLLISMHFAPRNIEKILSKKGKKFLNQNGPVGCRDNYTLENLEKNNIPCYFSGCLTLTLQKNDKIKKEDFVLCVDLPENIVEEIKSRTSRPVYNIPTEYHPSLDSNQRFQIADIYLTLIQKASCVVSKRLHAILPAIAFGTPAVTLFEKGYNTAEERFSGYEEMLDNKFDIDEFAKNKEIFNFDFPPAPRCTGFELVRDNLIKECSKFTGFNSEDPCISGEYTLFDLLGLMAYKGSEHILRSSYFLRNKILLKILFQKTFNKRARLDID